MSAVHTLTTHVPKLTISYCDFEYFLGWASLIHVETSSFTKRAGIYVKQGMDRGFDV